MDDSLKVVLVEDNESVGQSIQQMLLIKGYACQWFCSAEEVFEEPLASMELLIIDFKLPNMNGLELLDALRAHGVDCPALIVSGDLDANAATWISEIPRATWLQKPFYWADFERTVSQLLEADSVPVPNY